MKAIRSSALAAFACAMAVGVSAQQTPPAGQTQATGSASANKVTVSGCLARPGATATGTSGTAAPGGAGATTAAGAGAAKFVLNNAMAAGAPTTAGTTGAKMNIASSYQLDGDDAKLTPHIGHKVEITGTVEDKAASGTSATPGAASTTAAPRLKVESVKMIAATCTQ
jgi:hypothetical protein